MRVSDVIPEAITGPAALLYSLVPGRLFAAAQRRLAEAVDHALPGDARLVVDVGCGPGRLALELARRRPALHVVAVDLSPSMARIAGRRARGVANLEVRCEHAAHLSAADASVDFVVSAESMHHWREPVAVLDELHRVLRPGARAWIFDGRDDFDAADMAGWTVWGRFAPPRPLVAFFHVIFGTHGFTAELWRTRVPEIVRRSRFGRGSIEPVAMYRRLELVRNETPGASA